MNTSPNQTIENIKAEIAFRDKLAKQHVTGEVLVPNYYTKNEHDKIMLQRVNATKSAMENLQKHGHTLSPFIELGAERGQRALVLQNDFGAEGFAVDISHAQLKTMEYFAEFLGYSKLPLRVCCNAYNLPFKSNSFLFAFCYAFLHHFPNPQPILKEIFRVLSDGSFFFDSEPFKRIFTLNLYQQSAKNYWKKNKLLNFLESFIAVPYSEEEKYGILENDNISLSDWIAHFSVFENKELYLKYPRFSKWSTKLDRKVSILNLPNAIVGGTISGLCTKEEDNKEWKYPENLYDFLACPACQVSESVSSLESPSLVKYSDFLKCELCEAEYPIINNIIVLLTPQELMEFYPQFTKI